MLTLGPLLALVARMSCSTDDAAAAAREGSAPPEGEAGPMLQRVIGAYKEAASKPQPALYVALVTAAYLALACNVTHVRT